MFAHLPYSIPDPSVGGSDIIQHQHQLLAVLEVQLALHALQGACSHIAALMAGYTVPCGDFKRAIRKNYLMQCCCANGRAHVGLVAALRPVHLQRRTKSSVAVVFF